MAKDNQVLVRVNDPTHRAIEQFAEDRDYNKAEAVRRIVESRLKSEGYLTRELYGNDNEIRTDGSGGVVRPMLEFLSALYGSLILLIFAILSFALAGLRLSFVPYGELLPLLFSLSLGTSMAVVILYTRLPERIDWVVRDKVNWLRLKVRRVRA